MQSGSTIEITVSLRLPNGVDGASVVSELHARCAKEARSLQTEIDERARVFRALEDDDALGDWLGETGFGGAVVRAKSYGHECLPLFQEFWEFREQHQSGDLRRPVIMKGARSTLIKVYSRTYGNNCANGWCERIVERYLQMKKYTCFDGMTHYKNMKKVKRHLVLKGRYYLTHHFELPLERPIDWDTGCAFINGKILFGLTTQQRWYLEKLHKIRERALEADTRIAALKEITSIKLNGIVA